jgi:glycosyltransferase involved in cell wall biosynthesis
VKIAMVSEHANPLAVVGSVDAGGQNVHVADLARAMARQGAEVVVHTRRDDPQIPRRVRLADNVWVEHVDAGPARPISKDRLLPHMPAFSRQLSRCWRHERPDAVHSHFWMSGLASLEAARPLGIPLAHTYHALGVVKRRHQGEADTSPPERIDVERRLACEADHIVATTYDEARELAAMGGDPGRVTVVPCGVDLEHFRPDGPTERRNPWLRRVVVVSRLVERKGIGNVIAALATLPGVELVIAGGPPAGLLVDDPEAQRFLHLAEELGVSDRVELRGAVPRERLPELLRSADVVACCPWYEPFGLVAVEAMACGVPVVASAVGGLAESVIDGQTGIHVPLRAPEHIASAIRDLLDDEGRRRSLGAAGVRRARRFGWDPIAAETLAVAGRLALAASVPAASVPAGHSA